MFNTTATTSQPALTTSGATQYQNVIGNNLVDGTGVNYVPSDFGYRTVLFGDSMIDTYETVNSGLTASYDAASGDLTLTVTGHQQAVGWYVHVWNRGNTSTIKGRRLAVKTVIDANTLVVTWGTISGTVPTTLWKSRWHQRYIHPLPYLR